MTDTKHISKLRRIKILALGLVIALCAVGCVTEDPSLDPVFSADSPWASAKRIRVSTGYVSAWQYQQDTAVLYAAGSWEWVGSAPSVALMDIRQGNTTRLDIPGLSASEYYEFGQSPDGSRLAVSGVEVSLFDWATGQREDLGPGSSATFLPDGKSLAMVVNHYSTVAVLDLEKQTLEPVYWVERYVKGSDGQYSLLTGLIWNPVTDMFAVARETRERRGGNTTTLDDTVLIVAGDGTTTMVDFTEEQPARVETPAWSPDGRYLAAVISFDKDRGRFIIFDVHQSCVIHRESVDRVSRVFWSPDGQDLAFTFWPLNDVYLLSVHSLLGDLSGNLACLP